MKVGELLYRHCRALMMSGDTIIWRSNNLVGQLIRLFSRADVNHASTVITFRSMGVDRVMIAEAMAHGIELHSLSERLRKHKGKAYWLPLQPQYGPRRPGIMAWALDKIDVGYDYSNLFKQIFTRVRPNQKALFCSEFDFLAKRDGGKIPGLDEVKMAPRPGDLEGLGIYDPRVMIK